MKLFFVAGGHYLGCFKDNIKRDMVHVMPKDDQNTNDRCAATCRNKVRTMLRLKYL